MHSSVQAFFRQIVDYAGLFPPARLDLETAFHNYRDYGRGPQSWMLARFVIPASGLSALRELLDGASATRLSVIVNPEGTGVPALDDVRRFRRDVTPAVDMAVAESRLPRETVAGLPELRAYLADFGAAAEGLFHQLYFELPGNDISPEQVSLICEAARAYNTDRGPGPKACLKIRCGGSEPGAVPPAPFLAHFIEQCVGYDLQYKATAGLHHPLRSVDPDLEMPVFGFLNVFGAGILAATHPMNAREIEAILLEEDVAAYTFSPDEFAWRDRGASVSAIQRAREESIRSFGSCSFVEPVDDLKDLALI